MQSVKDVLVILLDLGKALEQAKQTNSKIGL